MTFERLYYLRETEQISYELFVAWYFYLRRLEAEARKVNG